MDPRTKIFVVGNNFYIGLLKNEDNNFYYASEVIQLIPTPEGKMAGIPFVFGLAENDVQFPKASTIVASPTLEAIKVYDGMRSRIQSNKISMPGTTYGGPTSYGNDH